MLVCRSVGRSSCVHLGVSVSVSVCIHLSRLGSKHRPAVRPSVRAAIGACSWQQSLPSSVLDQRW
eukprot:1779396-Alexandrium_andersonii.AAC.2